MLGDVDRWIMEQIPTSTAAAAQSDPQRSPQTE